MKIVGMVPVYNEADIIKELLTHLINQGIDPVVLDSGSTDGTYEICQRFLEKGKIKLEQYVSNKFEWATALRKLYDMALLESPDWVIHSDADEFLESYENNMDLKNAILQVDSEGYNLIQFNVFNFFMTKNDPISENSIKKRMLYYSFHFDFVFRAWKIYPGILPELKGGHIPVFPSDLKYKVWPKKFVLRHYQFRDKIQALKRINERIERISETPELKTGWHVHYNEIKNYSFSDPVDHSILQKYEGDNNWNLEYKFSFNPTTKEMKFVIPEDGVIKPPPTYHELLVLVNRLRKEIQELNDVRNKKGWRDVWEGIKKK